MGFLSGILDAAGHAVGPTLNLMAGRAQGQAIAQERQQQQLLQAYAMQRQQQQDALARSIATSNAQEKAALAAHYAHMDSAPKIMAGADGLYDVTDPKNPVPIGARKPAPPDPIATHRANRLFDVQHPTPVAPNNVYVTGVDPTTGKPTIYAGTNKGTPSLTNMNVGKPVGGGMGSSVSLSPEDRAKMLAQAKIDNQIMKDYENKVMQTGKTPGVVAGLAGAAASTGATGFMAQAGGILGNKATGLIDPDYQRYITAQRSYGRIMGNLQSKRYTDHQAEIERSISGLQGADLDETIQYKQRLRDASLDDPTVQPTAATPSTQPNDPGGNINLGETPKVSKAFDPDAFYRQYKGKKP